MSEMTLLENLRDWGKLDWAPGFAGRVKSSKSNRLSNPRASGGAIGLVPGDGSKMWGTV